MKRFCLKLLLLVYCVPAMVYAKHEVSVAQFGAVPNDGLNDCEALRRAVAYCREHAGTTLRFPAGIYDFKDDQAAEIERKGISGELGRGIEVQWALFNPHKPYVTGLDFDGVKNLTIEAEGAVLRVQGWMEVVSFKHARNVTVNGLTIDYKRPAATEARITQVTDSDFIAEFDPELYRYIDTIVQGRYHFYSPTKDRFYYAGADNPVLLAPGKIRVQSKSRPDVGDVFLIRYGGHYRPCIMLRESKNMTLRNVRILSHQGMGVVGHLSENILLDGIKIVPGPGRIIASTTDATHFTSCSGKITIQNSTFRGNCDDCTNIHNYYQRIYPQSEPNKVELRVEGADLHAQWLDYPAKGDTLQLIDNQNFELLDSYVVKAVDVNVEKWQVIVTLNKPFKQPAGRSAAMINHTRFPKVEILNNTVYYHLGRSFLLKVPHSIVRGNRIQNPTHTAIKLGAELSWNEGGPVEYALIENNYFWHCGESVGRDGASCVMVITEARQTPPYVNRNIIIRNNIIDTRQQCAILLQDAQNVQIYDNIINSTDYVRQNHSKDIKIW